MKAALEKKHLTVNETELSQLYQSRTLSLFRRFSFGVGHFFNDMCASMWFSYMIVFYHLVLGIDNSLAGTLVLIGQIADACATPVIGYLCDNTRSRYGRRKIWHFSGTVMVAVSFFFFWHHCLGCQSATSNLQILYFSSFIVVFQVGWAAVQIAHLALIPELVSDENDRVGLNAIRYAFTIISSVVVYGAMWGLLLHFGALTGGRINSNDEWIFSGTALGIIGTGLVFTTAFHLFTYEPSTTQQQNTEMARGLTRAWYMWFLSPQFYLVAIIYMTTRLVVNFSQVYTPLYVLDTLLLDKANVATVPLATFIASFLTTIAVQHINKLIGRNITYLVALIVLAGSLILLYYQKPPTSIGETLGVYEAMVLLGIGGTILYVTSLSMVADLIGFTVGSSAFVYGVMSFADKLCNGLAVQIAQSLHPCSDSSQNCGTYYRQLMVFVPAGASVMALISLVILALLVLMKKHCQAQNKPSTVMDDPSNDVDEPLIDESTPLIQD